MSQILSDHTVSQALLVVAAALVDRQGRVLMQQRPPDRQHGGLWEFPGGKLEPGEGPAEALVRELREELALTIAPDNCAPLGFAAKQVHSIGERPVVLLLFGCRDWLGEPVSQEGAQWAWVAPDDFARLAMPPLDVPLIPHVVRFAALG